MVDIVEGRGSHCDDGPCAARIIGTGGFSESWRYVAEIWLTGVLLLVLVPGVVDADVGSGVGGGEVSRPPPHVNHTFLGQLYSSGGFGCRVVAVGDVEGRRQVILWLELSNEASSVWPVDSAAIKAIASDEADGPGGLEDLKWRVCSYASWSVQGEPYQCIDGSTHPAWRHGTYRLDPGSSATCWVVFQLPKYEFDSMRRLTVQLPCPEVGGMVGGVVAGVPISSGRHPGYVPYLRVLVPADGENLTWLTSVRFQISDTDYRPVNWSVELDGQPLSNGAALPGHPDLCPIEVREKIGHRAVPRGPHRMVVRAWDGRVSENVSVDFSLQHAETPELELEWAISTSNIFPGTVFGPGRHGCQTVWDIDGDGVNEVLFGNWPPGNDTVPPQPFWQEARLWCFDAAQNLEWVYPPPEREPLPGPPTSKPSLIDVNSDGVHEVCLAGMGGRLHAINPDGSLHWFWDNPNARSSMHGPPQALDVDGDGFPEFFIHDNRGDIHRVSHEGELEWSFTAPPGEGGDNAPPTICDIDQDGEHEAVWANSPGTVRCVDAETGMEEWVFDSGAAMRYQPVMVADVNRDREYEAIFCTETPGRVTCLTFYGKELWSWSLPPGDGIWMCQAMGDVDRDGGMDMVIMSTSSMICLNIHGIAPELVWEVNTTRWIEEGLIPPGATTHPQSSYQLIADIDGDQDLEVLWQAPYPIITDASTGQLEAYYLNQDIGVNQKQENGGWWGDIDSDGVSEWICELSGNRYTGDYYNKTRIYCLTHNAPYPAQSPWPEHYHTAYPAKHQQEQDWLTLKSAGSNSLWFPIREQVSIILFFAGVWKIASSRQGVKTGLSDDYGG